MGYLPEKWKYRLANWLGAPGRYKNADSHMLLLIAANRRLGSHLVTDNPLKSRAHFDAKMSVIQGKRPVLKCCEDLNILATGGHHIKARHYVPIVSAADAVRLPLVVFYHGGGFVVGNVDTHDEFCHYLCHVGQVQVLSIDYRLAPEHPAPAAINDCKDALVWAHDHADTLGVDKDRIAVVGDSAGGNLAAVVSQLTKGTAYAPAMQCLIYPVTDAGHDYPSYHDYGKGLFITLKDRYLFERFYVAQSGIKLTDPLIAPMRGTLTGCAPAYLVTAELDILRDEGEAYAHALKKAGVPVESKRMLGLPHGFINMINIHHGARLATLELINGFTVLLYAR